MRIIVGILLLVGLMFNSGCHFATVMDCYYNDSCNTGCPWFTGCDKDVVVYPITHCTITTVPAYSFICSFTIVGIPITLADYVGSAALAVAYDTVTLPIALLNSKDED
jgi:hypothetical protein